MKPRTSASPIKLGVGTPACELRDVVSDRCHEYPGALPEDQVDQHDRENADEAELDELPQELFCKAMLAMNLRMAEPLDDTYGQWVGSVAPHPDCVSNSV